VHLDNQTAMTTLPEVVSDDASRLSELDTANASLFMNKLPEAHAEVGESPAVEASLLSMQDLGEPTKEVATPEDDGPIATEANELVEAEGAVGEMAVTLTACFSDTTPSIRVRLVIREQYSLADSLAEPKQDKLDEGFVLVSPQGRTLGRDGDGENTVDIGNNNSLNSLLFAENSHGDKNAANAAADNTEANAAANVDVVEVPATSLIRTSCANASSVAAVADVCALVTRTTLSTGGAEPAAPSLLASDPLLASRTPPSFANMPPPGLNKASPFANMAPSFAKKAPPFPDEVVAGAAEAARDRAPLSLEYLVVPEQAPACSRTPEKRARTPEDRSRTPSPKRLTSRMHVREGHYPPTPPSFVESSGSSFPPSKVIVNKVVTPRWMAGGSEKWGSSELTHREVRCRSIKLRVPVR
jgi:hypothetical protein